MKINKKAFSVVNILIVGWIAWVLFFSKKYEEKALPEIALKTCQTYFTNKFQDIDNKMKFSFAENFKTKFEKTNGNVASINIIQEIYVYDAFGNGDRNKYDCNVKKSENKNDWYVAKFFVLDDNSL